MRNLFYELNIEVKGNAQQQKVKCPNCKKVGHKEHNDTPLSVNFKDGTYNCHRCGWSGCVKKGETKSYTQPVKSNFTKLTDKGLQLFTGRGITQEVVISNKIAQEGNEWVIFPYLRENKLVNVKKRAIENKDFRQSTGSEAIIYNYDRVKDQSEIIICEGEFDCMAFEVAGFTNVTSVNQGAPNENDKNIDKKLECITNCYEVFEQAKIIYIAVDKDPNGQRLEKELIRRFGQEKCRIVLFPNNHKDANEVLIHENKQTLKDCIKNSIEVKVDGIFNLDDVKDSMLATFDNGKVRGTTTYYPDFDKVWTHRSGEVTTWTGYANEGKSTFLKQLLIIDAKFNGTKIAVFSPEEFPADEFYDDLIHTYIGKSTDSFYSNVMNRSEYLAGMDFIKKHFFYVYPEKDHQWQTVKEKMLYLVRSKGIKRMVFDPFNQFDHIQGSKMIDQYVSWFMSQLKRLALETDTSVHLVAHQTTPQTLPKTDYPEPDMYKIKGGGTFADKTDNAGSVWRPFKKTDKINPSVIVNFQKVKKHRLTGEGGEIEFIFNKHSNRYYINGYNPLDHIEQKQETLIENTDFLNQAKPITPSKYNELGELISDFELNNIKDEYPF